MIGEQAAVTSGGLGVRNTHNEQRVATGRPHRGLRGRPHPRRRPPRTGGPCPGRGHPVRIESDQWIGDGRRLALLRPHWWRHGHDHRHRLHAQSERRHLHVQLGADEHRRLW